MTQSDIGTRADDPHSSHERALDRFYSQFPYPPQSSMLERLDDGDLYRRLVCQDLGDYDHRRLPERGKIWVAGCGTNQALITALRYPAFSVLGTDVSTESLRVCAESSRQLQVDNLTLRQEGIGKTPYRAEFDYIVCTGVIHHNPEPPARLRALATALRPTGVLELMVYNKDHRRAINAFREATQLLGMTSIEDLDQRYETVRRLAAALPAQSPLGRTLRDTEEMSEAAWADAWMNPCEFSYGVDELHRMAEACGLVLETPCPNQFDAADFRSWELEFTDPEIQMRFDDLEDLARWRLTGLVQDGDSPHAWFYLSSAESGRRSESERNAAFRGAVFDKCRTSRRLAVLDDTGRYETIDHAMPFPAGAPHSDVQSVYQALDGRTSMGELLDKADLGRSHSQVSRARRLLASSQFPFAMARP